jgi:hypothetical protein
MNSLKNIFLRLPFVSQARELRWTVDRNNRVLERTSADLRRLADRTDACFAATEKLLNIAVDDYLDRHLYRNQRYLEKGRLNRYERQIFSQAGEDGIIGAIFSRIGTSNRYFVEFGVGRGVENNTASLLIEDWRGYWIEANSDWVRDAEKSFKTLLAGDRLRVRHAFVTAENVESLFEQGGVPPEFDLLSVDIDGNDFWVWEAIGNYRPRVVVIEYNAAFGPAVRWAVRYDPAAVWDGTTQQGASLKSLELLGERKGYCLVACSFSGVNAFFVRKDLVGDAFCSPFTSENHYEPPRYHLIRTPGHPRGFGDFVAA